MNVVSTTGFILRVRPFSDTTLIVQWLTPEFGRIATIAKGARRPKSPFRGRLDLFYKAAFSFTRSARSELHTLREAQTLETHRHLRLDLTSVAQASYAAALIEQATETETSMPEIEALFGGFLSALDQGPAPAQTIFAFEMKLLGELGLAPDLEDASLTPGSRQIVQRLGELDWGAVSRLRLSGTQIPEIRHYLHQFLAFHLGKVPRSREGALR